MHHLAGRAHHPSLAMIRPPPLVTMTLLNRLLESGTRTPSREKEKERERERYIYREIQVVVSGASIDNRESQREIRDHTAVASLGAPRP